MKSKKVRMKLAGQSYPVLIALGKRVNSFMTGNPDFATPPADLAEVLTNANALTLSYSNAKATNSKQEWADCRKNKAALKVNLLALANYVNVIAKGSEEVILSAGMEVTRDPSSTPAPEQVGNVQAQFTGQTGTIKLLWATARYTRMYDVFMTSTPATESSWILVNSITARKLLVSNLATGTRYWFRVVAKGIKGNAIPSEPADQIAA